MDARYDSFTDSYTITLTAEELLGHRRGIKVGDKVILGRWPQEAYGDEPPHIEWEVAKIEDGKALLISTHVLEPCVFSIENCNDYSTSDVRRWLCCEFLEAAFCASERKMLCLHEITHGCFTEYVFLPSKEEFELLPDMRRKATERYKMHGYTDDGYGYAWTRSASPSDASYAYRVTPSGAMYYISASIAHGVAPACWVNLKSLNQAR